MSNYLSNALTPANQREPLPGQTLNSAGGYSYAVDDWTRLARFLVLGSEGGSYYATERKLTRENAAAVERCIAADGPRTVREIVAISDAGRAAKNDPAILALALCAKLGNDDTRAAAYAALPKVCRIGTHLYHFVTFAEQFGKGWGRGMRRAVGRWFNDRKADDVAHQVMKYQARDGWSARDLLRLAHPKPTSPEHDAIYAWVSLGADDAKAGGKILPPAIEAFEEVKAIADDASRFGRALQLIGQYRLPRECVPSELLAHPEVWEAMLPHMGLTAVIRNLATMTRIGMLAPLGASTATVCARICDPAQLKQARVHPISVLSALRTYARGHGVKSDKTWTPLSQVTDALDAGFYAAFGAIEPAGKRTMIALDVSGSMTSGEVGGVPGLSPREASVAMAMVTAATEPQCIIKGFSTQFIDVNVSPRKRLDDNLRVVNGLPFSGTDCSLPMLWATKNKIDVDTFIVYTDSETWAGNVHPTTALQQYRKASGIQAREAVVGMMSSDFTIADPNDPGQLDVVGFDTATPGVLSEFSRGVRE